MEREPERVEIELTPTDAPSSRGSQPRTSVSSHVPSPARLLATERSRLVTTGLVVGVFALGLGWIAGRAGGENGPSADATPSSTTAPPTTVPGTPTGSAPPVVAADTIAPVADEVVSPPQPTTPATPTIDTTTMADPSLLLPTYVLPAEVDERLSGSGVRLAGTDRSGGLLSLDVDDGLLERTLVDAPGFDPTWLIAGADWLAFSVADTNGVGLFVTSDGEQPTSLPSGGAEVLHEVGSDRFWRPSAISEIRRPTRWEEFDLTGVTSGREVDVPAGWAVGVDPLGGLVVVESAKTFRVDLDGQITLLADGDLLGLSTKVVVYRGCDEVLNCSVWVLDRASGERRPIGMDGLRDTQVVSTMNWGGSRQASPVSPDGSAIAVVVFGAVSASISLIDLDDGTVTDLAALAESPQVSWSEDRRWAFFLDGSVPMAYDRETRETFPVAEGVDGWASVVVRPVAG